MASRERDGNGITDLSLPRLAELWRRGMVSPELWYGQRRQRTRIVVGRHGGPQLWSSRQLSC